MISMKALAITAAALAAGAIFAGPAHASPAHAPSAQATPAGIGFGTTLNTPTVTMYSAPVSGTYNVGTAHEGDNIADLCWIYNDNTIWDLVLDRNGYGGNHVGNTAAFIPEKDLQNQTQSLNCGSLPGVYPDPDADDPVTLVNPYNNSSMYSAPSGGYYAGTENSQSSPPFADICDIGGWDMILDYDGMGNNHFFYTVAFVPRGDIVNYNFGYFQYNAC